MSYEELTFGFTEQLLNCALLFMAADIAVVRVQEDMCLSEGNIVGIVRHIFVSLILLSPVLFWNK